MLLRDIFRLGTAMGDSSSVRGGGDSASLYENECHEQLGSGARSRGRAARHAPGHGPGRTRAARPFGHRYQEDLVTPGRKPAWACSRSRTRESPKVRR
ncbi:hypothetical protein GCM10017562_72510 [Streptomyces roseofulvus]